MAPNLGFMEKTMDEKPLFIPLKREWFEAFASHQKTEEYRPAGGRWNERTCRIGRAVVLSMGYGKGRRLTGTITGFMISEAPCQSSAWKGIYGDKTPAAIITIRLDPDQ